MGYQSFMRLFAAVLLSLAPLMGQPAFRPPAVPLVAHDPYFSIWSMSDHLTDTATRHWTGVDHALTGVLRIDGRPYRFMGLANRVVPAMKQIGLQVMPTRTLYAFEENGVRLNLIFFTPA